MIIFLIVVLLVIISVCVQEQLLIQRHPDVGLNVKQLIQKYGYPFENHTVVTEDGYILELHRIPHGKNGDYLENKPPALFVSGFLCTSVDWVNMGPEKSLGFILADQGYDIWLANYRGTTWSRKHRTLNPDIDKKEFWNYSFHEIGYYDIKAFIDHILGVTNQKKIFYFGHSQGGTSFFALLSERPEYDEKIRFATLFAPVTTLEEAKGIVIYLVETYDKQIEEFAEQNQFYEVLPHSPLITLAGEVFCHDYSPYQNLCASVFFILAGYSPKQFNKTMIPVIASNTPAGASVKQLLHYGHIRKSHSFIHYDYGKVDNYLKYGQATPPLYNISGITTPVAFYYGSKDVYIGDKDVDLLTAQLSNVVLKRKIRGFNHLDYIWGIDAVEIVFKEVLELLKRY